MKAYEIPLRLDKNGNLNIPDKVMSLLKKDETIRTIFLIGEDDDDENSWRMIVKDQFLKGYSESDAVYDKI
jgi:hypothetical protein